MDRYQINVLRYMNDGNPVTQINSTAGEYRIIATTLLVVGIIFGYKDSLWFIKKNKNLIFFLDIFFLDDKFILLIGNDIVDFEWFFEILNFFMVNQNPFVQECIKNFTARISLFL